MKNIITENSPKVFLSHANDDKERFVLDFATKLRGKGIDVWLDKWEMLVGDSLIDKIFEEGIKNAQAIIIVLSKFSVYKSWVKEELNAAIVKKINGLSKIIPILIDDCEVPEALQSTLWITINDLNNYDDELNQIVNAIIENREKPPLGKLPSYAQTILDIIPNLTKIDSIVLKLACEEANNKGNTFISTGNILEGFKTLDVEEKEVYESLEILHSRRYIKGHKVHDGTNKTHSFSINVYGYESYAKTYVENYSDIVRSVIAEIVNLNNRDSITISNSLKQPIRLINHIIETLEERDFIGIIKSSIGDNKISIFNYSPELKRQIGD